MLLLKKIHIYCLASLSFGEGLRVRSKTTIMKKLLLYLLLIACFECFISATPSLCFKQKTVSSLTNINVSQKDETLLKGDVNTDIHPLDIFTYRYF